MVPEIPSRGMSLPPCGVCRSAISVLSVSLWFISVNYKRKNRELNVCVCAHTSHSHTYAMCVYKVYMCICVVVPYVLVVLIILDSLGVTHSKQGNIRWLNFRGRSVFRLRRAETSRAVPTHVPGKLWKAASPDSSWSGRRARRPHTACRDAH